MTFRIEQLIRVNHLAQEHGIMADSVSLAERREEGALGRVMGVQQNDGSPALVWVQHKWGLWAPYWDYELILLGDPNARK